MIPEKLIIVLLFIEMLIWHFEKHTRGSLQFICGVIPSAFGDDSSGFGPKFLQTLSHFIYIRSSTFVLWIRTPTAAYAFLFSFFFGSVLGYRMGAILSNLDRTLRKCYWIACLSVLLAKGYLNHSEVLIQWISGQNWSDPIGPTDPLNRSDPTDPILVKKGYPHFTNILKWNLL